MKARELKRCSITELCELILEGSEAAWEYMVCEVVIGCAKAEAAKMAGHYMATSEDIEDAVQSTVEHFLKHGRAVIARFTNKGAWLKPFVRRQLISAYRRRGGFSTELVGEEEADESYRNAENVVMVRDTVEAVCHDDMDRFFLMALKNGMTRRQIAKVLGWKLYKVQERVNLLRSRAKAWVGPTKVRDVREKRAAPACV